MATYNELLTLAGDSDLIARTRVACVVASYGVGIEVNTTPNHAARVEWSKRVFSNPEFEATRMLWILLAQNKDLTLTQIKAVSDADLQVAVSGAVNILA